jgi:hypothetical protein
LTRLGCVDNRATAAKPLRKHFEDAHFNTRLSHRLDAVATINPVAALSVDPNWVGEKLDRPLAVVPAQLRGNDAAPNFIFVYWIDMRIHELNGNISYRPPIDAGTIPAGDVYAGAR